jgi:hypothetical protein
VNFQFLKCSNRLLCSPAKHQSFIRTYSFFLLPLFPFFLQPMPYSTPLFLILFTFFHVLFYLFYEDFQTDHQQSLNWLMQSMYCGCVTSILSPWKKTGTVFSILLLDYILKRPVYFITETVFWYRSTVSIKKLLPVPKFNVAKTISLWDNTWPLVSRS